MKIAAVTATFPPYHGGVGNVAYHNARLLSDRGHQVTVLTQEPPAGTTRPAVPFRIEYLRPLFTLGNAPLLPRLAMRLQGYDLIHLHYPFIFGTEMTLHAARRYRIPLLVTYHNRLLARAGLKKGLFSAYNLLVEPRALRCAHRVVAVSQDHFHSLFPHVPCLEVPNGVDIDLFRPRPRTACRRLLSLPDSGFLALFVGTLDAAHAFKNLPALLRALQHLHSVHLIVVGEGSLREQFMRQAAGLGIAGRVRFVGSRNHDQLPWYYSAADITVLPSNQTESFGMVLIESMACGTPVIATNLPGVRQVVKHRETGLLIPPDDDAALYGALRWMADHPRERVAMGHQGRITAERQYAWAIVGQQLEGACFEALKWASSA
ncbi:MAG: glycosyltransferase family 4 protein [Firmicutes bacterium]|nr:glycosyltransferase family 4 protein [Bacillota bacterium]